MGAQKMKKRMSPKNDEEKNKIVVVWQISQINNEQFLKLYNILYSYEEVPKNVQNNINYWNCAGRK